MRGAYTLMMLRVMSCEPVSYLPGSHADSVTSSPVLFFSWLTPAQAASSSASSATWLRLAIRGAPLRAVFEAEVHEALQQLAIGGAGGARRLGEVLGHLEVGIGVGFQHVHLPLRGHAEIHASITGHAERPIDAP